MLERILFAALLGVNAIWTINVDSSTYASATQMKQRRIQRSFRETPRTNVRGQALLKSTGKNSLPHVSRRLQAEDLFKDCGKDKKTTCSPTASPSASPSQEPSVSFAPTSSPMPSAPPSTSVAPSFSPSSMPTSSPSDQPSSVPTITGRPSTSPSQSPSDAPSAVPSISPTPEPTGTPTFYPTPLPSAAPSLSQHPTITPQPTNTNYPTVDPNGYSTVVFIGPNRLPEKNSTCRPSIPSNANSVTSQIIAFDYVANVVQGSNITLAISSISLRLQDELAKEYLDCSFPPGEDFYTHAVNSLPGDVVSTTASCSSSQVADNSDCYIVEGAFTVVIFYLPDSQTSRRLADSSSSGGGGGGSEANNITDPKVYESFSMSLDDIFASGALQTAQVTGLQFEGISNNNSPAPAPKATNSGAIVGGIIGGIVLLLLLLFVIYTMGQREKRRRQYPEQVAERDLDDEDSLNRPYEDDPSAQEDQPFANIPLTSSPDEIASAMDESSLPGNVRVVVVNEEESLVSGFPPPVGLYDGDDAPDDEPKPPRFYKMRELGGTPPPTTSPTYYQPNPGRAYDVADTVDL